MMKDGSKGREDYQHWVFGTTRVKLTDREIIWTYELRPEIEEDHRQWKDVPKDVPKDEPWNLEDFTSTSMLQIFYHIISVLLSYNLMKLYSNTNAVIALMQS